MTFHNSSWWLNVRDILHIHTHGFLEKLTLDLEIPQWQFSTETTYKIGVAYKITFHWPVTCYFLAKANYSLLIFLTLTF